jgi:predicted nucleotidyltransferase
MPETKEINILKNILKDLKEKGKVLIALVYGSYARGIPQTRSDIDLALYLKAVTVQEEIETIDRILMATDREISILRLVAGLIIVLHSKGRKL